MNDFQEEIRFALSDSNLQIKTQFHINVPANTRDAARYSGYLLFRKAAVWELKNEQLWNNGCLPGLSHGPTTFESVYKWFSYWWERGFSI